MTHSGRNPMSDEDLLEVMDMHEGDGDSYEVIAVQFNRTRSGIAGSISRVQRELAKTDADGNQNGTMPRGWWRR